MRTLGRLLLVWRCVLPANRKLLSLLLLCGIFVAGFACSDDDDDAQDSVGGAESAFCDDLSEVRSSVDKLKDLDSSSTVNEARDAVDDVKGPVDELRGSAGNVAQAEAEELQSAFASLQSAIQNIPGEQTLGAFAAAIRAGVSGVQQAVDELGIKGSCS
jgi:hypothetical protein